MLACLLPPLVELLDNLRQGWLVCQADPDNLIINGVLVEWVRMSGIGTFKCRHVRGTMVQVREGGQSRLRTSTEHILVLRSIHGVKLVQPHAGDGLEVTDVTSYNRHIMHKSG